MNEGLKFLLAGAIAWFLLKKYQEKTAVVTDQENAIKQMTEAMPVLNLSADPSVGNKSTGFDYRYFFYKNEV